MLQWKRDLIISVSVLLFCVFNYIYTARMNTDVIKYGLAKPGNYVRMWLVIFAVLAVILLVRALKNRTGRFAAPIWHRAAVITVTATVTYLLLMPYLGFYIMTVLFIAGLGLVYTHYMRKKVLKGKTFVQEMIRWLIFSIISTVFLYLIFVRILNVILPKFSLF